MSDATRHDDFYVATETVVCAQCGVRHTKDSVHLCDYTVVTLRGDRRRLWCDVFSRVSAGLAAGMCGESEELAKLRERFTKETGGGMNRAIAINAAVLADAALVEYDKRWGKPEGGKETT